MPLTDAACRAAKSGSKLKKLSDMCGLQLWIQTTGSKLWRYAYRFDGKQKLLALGKYPELSLASARPARDAAKTTLAGGSDPSAAKQLAKLMEKTRDDRYKTVAEKDEAKQRREGRAEAPVGRIAGLPRVGHEE